MITTPQNHTAGDRITQKDLHILTHTREPYCISIYLPTHTTGEEVLQGRDAQALDVELRKIRKSLEDIGLTPQQIAKRLDPLEELREDGAFWREQAGGLAIFATEDWMKAFRLPTSFRPEFRLANHFYIVPLTAELGDAREFYLLALELERIRLFRGSRHGMEEISVSGRIPDRMEDRVGYDYEEKGLQFRSQHQAHSAAGYHGHDEADRDRKNEIQRFFRSVDKGLLPLLREAPAPLLIASQEYLASIYREVTSYQPVLDEILTANLSEVSDPELWEQALGVINPIFDREQQEKWARFEEFHGSGKATGQMDRILMAALEGKVDALFVNREAELRGTFDPDTRTMKVVSDPGPFDESLVNLAVNRTLEQGGTVYLIEPEDLPKGSDTAVALFRY